MSATKRPAHADSPELIHLDDDAGDTKRPRVDQIPENPLGLYFTKTNGIESVYNQFLAVDIKEILSAGQLLSSAQFSYEIDLPWLIQQYPAEFRSAPLLLVHQDSPHLKAELRKEATNYPQVSLCPIYMPVPYGTHHSKIMLLEYESSIRIVITTANLCEGDWRRKTQAVWLSPLLPKVAGCAAGDLDSPTNFKRDLIGYLSTYRQKSINAWIDKLRQVDFTSIRVFLVASIPGRHVAEQSAKYGHLRIRSLLRKHGPPGDLVTPEWAVVGQFSSIGSLGPKPESYLRAEFLTSFSATSKPSSQAESVSNSLGQSTIKLVFPAVRDVQQSLDGWRSGGSLPYSVNTHKKQIYMKKFMHRWLSESKGRTEASPHIKTFFRISPDSKSGQYKLAYLYVGSSNLSKAAWGVLEKSNTQLAIRSYEIGVLYLPSQFGSDLFNVSDGLCVDGKGTAEEPYSVPLPVDLPLTPYSAEDEPWQWDEPKRYPDRNGNMWCPD